MEESTASTQEKQCNQNDRSAMRSAHFLFK
jgi:hypothetical protein